MSWLGHFTTRFLGSFVDAPNKVIEVSSEKYTDRVIICREDCIVFYGPASKDKKYEIVILKAYCEQAYSLFRSENKEDAKLTFIQLKDKLPTLLIISVTINSLSGIQKVCDAVSEVPSWTIMHLAVHLNLTDCLQHEELLKFLNTPDSFSGLTPIHLAIKKQNLAVVRTLVAAKAALEQLDHEANSVFHYAANTNKDIIMALLVNGQPSCLNARNASGYTPLHIACLENKTDCVQTLLSQGADVNISAYPVSSSSNIPPGFVGDFMATPATKKLYIQDMKFGGTPLHWSCSREVIEQLVDRNCDINVLNFDKRTALHIMVLRNRLECVIALLSRYADIDIPDKDGNTALHLAVKEKNIPVIQALIVFGADLAFMNGEGQTPRHLATQGMDELSDRILYMLHSVGAPRCALDTHGCTDGCMMGGDRNGIPPPVPPSAQVRAIMRCFECTEVRAKNTRGGRVLCLDGGGIRGLVLVTVLLHLEDRVKQPIIHCFDWVAGTSTGAILALGLAAGKSLKDCLCLYFRMKEYAFVGSKPYASEPLETMLQQALGTETVMADIRQPKQLCIAADDLGLMITGVLADRKPVDLHLFRNYLSPSEIVDPLQPSGSYAAPPPMEEQLLWKAARASGAAPSYFRAFGRFIDGGLIANNPTMDALTEIHEYNTALREVGRGGEVTPPTVVVSVGTGCVPVKQLSNVDIFRPESVWETVSLAMGITAISALLVDQATQADGRVIDRCSAWCSMINVPYFRFSPQLSEDIVMDEKSDEKLVNMLWETKAYILANDRAIVRLASLLCCDDTVSQGSKRKRKSNVSIPPPQDIKFLSKRRRVNVPVLETSDSDDEPVTPYNFWRKYF